MKTRLFISLTAALIANTPVFAQETTQSTSPASPLGSPTGSPAGAPAVISAPGFETPTSGNVAPANATTAGAIVGQLAPGPLIEARKMLWNRIQQAKDEGIGTAAYVSAFAGVEDEVRAGKTAEQLRPRIESLARSLKEQLDRGKILKTQRPSPPTASQTGGGASLPPPTGPAGGSSESLSAALGSKSPSDTKALIDKAKGALLNGGEIPDSLKQQIMQSDKGRKILEKLGL